MGGKNLSRVEIGRRGLFSLEQANAIIPVVLKITEAYSREADELMKRLEAISNDRTDIICQIESEINELVEDWHSKIKKLGGKPKGLWLMDLDAGDGYYCWKYPEKEIIYWHSYTDGFTGRILVSDHINMKNLKPQIKEVENQPSWNADQ